MIRTEAGRRLMTEYDRAKNWRLARQLTLEDLAKLTGYSTGAISCFERGTRNPAPGEFSRKPLNPSVFARYKIVCEAIEARMRNPQRKQFDWGA